jgi:LacI family transcriptional regulator
MPRGYDRRDEIDHDPRGEVALKLLSQPHRPTAVIAYEIEVVMPLYHAALRLGLDVPRDLSLAMFHGELNTQIGVPFTTMHLWLSEIGKQAVQILLQKIDRPHELIPARALHADFFEGATCAPPH